MRLKLTDHTIVIDDNDFLFLLYNVIIRSGVLIEKSFFSENFSENFEKKYLFIDITTFSLSNSLVDNPNGILNKIEYENIKKVAKKEILEKCQKLSILSKDNSYLNKIGLKTSIFDNEHVGNFHQQIGQFLLKNKKSSPEKWWIYQKFNKNISKVRDNPYRWVQESFIKSYFDENFLKNKAILDFGGGVGYYSNYFALFSKSVDLVDPNEMYIELGKSFFGKHKNLNFVNKEFVKKEDFNILKKKYDYIFLIDVFLYYFVNYKKIDISPSLLLKELSKKLNKNGKVFIIDPHGIFHLQPYFRNKKPFIISTEYTNRKFRATPTLEEMSVAIENSGLKILKIRELKYEGKDSDKIFYHEFPFWWFFELSN